MTDRYQKASCFTPLEVPSNPSTGLEESPCALVVISQRLPASGNRDPSGVSGAFSDQITQWFINQLRNFVGCLRRACEYI